MLIEVTPVDTGWARANWVPSIGHSSNVPATFAGRTPTPGEVKAKEAEQAAGMAGVLGYKLGRGSVFISNNVTYITLLNDGSSPKAPKMFVQASIHRGLTAVERRFS